jgi:hypothetical protein
MRGTASWDVDADLLDGLDSTAFVSAASQTWASTHRHFYLSTGTFDGSQALGGCADGFHMASLWSILDVSNLVYDTSLGATADDSADGPPEGALGWIRTGGGSVNAGGALPGYANCFAWTTTVGSGTRVSLQSLWNWYQNDDAGPDDLVPRIAPWLASTAPCTETLPVWCVED